MKHMRLMCGFDRIPRPMPLSDVQESTRTSLIKAIESGEIVLLQRDACPCGSTSRKPVSLTDRFLLPFGSYLCEACGLIYTSPYISPESANKYYENFYVGLHYIQRPAAEEPFFAEGQGAKIFGLIKDRLKGSSANLLEIGCAGGSVMKEFATAARSSGVSVQGLGLEYDNKSAANFNPEGLDIILRRGGIEDLRPGDGPFDIVIMSHVMEHFPDPGRELTALKGFLAEGAILYIEVPGLFNLKRMYRLYKCDYLKYFTGAHTFNFTLYSLAHVMGMYGYRLLWGNEVVESIFALGESTLDITGNARMVEACIDDMETGRKFYQSLWEGIGPLEKQVESLTREVAILKDERDRLRGYLPYRLYNYIRRKIYG